MAPLRVTVAVGLRHVLYGKPQWPFGPLPSRFSVRVVWAIPADVPEKGLLGGLTLLLPVRLAAAVPTGVGFL